MTTDFSTSISVAQSPEKVFDAILNPQDWWSGEIKGEAKKLGDEFAYSYKEFHFSKQKLVEVIPNKKVVWLVTDSSLSFVEDKNEWTGTKISFDITEQDGKTVLTFTHHGLAPEVECFDSCSGAWTQLIHQGLFSLITEGEAEKVNLG